MKVYDVSTGQPIAGPLGNFFAYDPDYRGGVFVGTDWKTGDVTGDGHADLITGPGKNHAPSVHVYDGKTGQLDRSFAAFNSSTTAGVRVASAYVTDDAYADIVCATGKGFQNEVRVFDGKDKVQLAGNLGKYTPFGQSTNGLTLTASNDPPNKYGFYDLPVSEHFPEAKFLDPIYITPGANRYEVDETVILTGDGKRLRWDVTLTNKGLAGPGDYGFTDFGISYFHLETRVIDDVEIIDNKNGWQGYVSEDMGGSSGDYLVWSASAPIFVGDSVLLSFETPVVPLIPGSSLAASIPLGEGGPGSEAQTTCQIVTPGTRSIIEIRSGVTNTFTDTLYVANWENAYQPSNIGNNLSVLKPVQNGIDVFDLDERRFNIWIEDEASWFNDVEHIFAGLTTANVADYSAYDDNRTEIGLVRVPAVEGWYCSDSLILVSNDTDDDYNVNFSKNDDENADDSQFNIKHDLNFPLSDRTHRISLGGQIEVDYYKADLGLATVPVEHEITVRPHIVRMTATTQPATANEVLSYIKKNNEWLAQIGVRLSGDQPNVFLPTSPFVDTSNRIELNNAPGAGRSEIYYILEDPLSLATPQTNDIDFFIFDTFTLAGNPVGTHIGAAYPVFFQNIPNYIVMQWQHDRPIELSGLSKLDAPASGVLAHEVFHLLLNS